MVLKPVRFSSREEALDYATAHWITCADEAIKKRGRFCVALSGGSTPKVIYQRLRRAKLDWSSVFLFWSDERAVPPDHPDSNYRMAMEACFAHVPIPEENIFRMEAESDIEVHAASYQHLIKTIAQSKLDLVMLGMGGDGHTASLFPNTKALLEKEALVVPNYIPDQDSWRMTFTFPCINQARAIAIYVLGSEKKERLDEVLSTTTHLPIQQVGAENSPALVITDIK